MNFLNKLERTLGKYAVKGLMKYLILCYIVGYVLKFAAPDIYSYLTLEPFLIIHHLQLWRIVSWILIPPPTGNIIFAAIMLFLYYQLGNTLENSWGAFKFNLYIFGGMIFTIIGAFVLYGIALFLYGTGEVSVGSNFSTYYINMGIFLAFALSYPEMRIMLYFIIPIKMKWMALVYAAFIIFDMVRTSWAGRVAILASILNFLIFFLLTRNYRKVNPKEVYRRQQFKQAAKKPASQTMHKCAICGRTEADNPDLVFRFCSKCNGNFEYCQDHLFTHVHK